MILYVLPESLIDLEKHVLCRRSWVEDKPSVSIFLKPFNFTSQEQWVKVDNAMLYRSVHYCCVNFIIADFFDEESCIFLEFSAGIYNLVALNDMLNFLSFRVQNYLWVRFQRLAERDFLIINSFRIIVFMPFEEVRETLE
jgi:hypothetical protein